MLGFFVDCLVTRPWKNLWSWLQLPRGVNKTEVYHCNIFYFFLLASSSNVQLCRDSLQGSPSEAKGNLWSFRASKDIGVIL